MVMEFYPRVKNIITYKYIFFPDIHMGIPYNNEQLFKIYWLQYTSDQYSTTPLAPTLIQYLIP